MAEGTAGGGPVLLLCPGFLRGTKVDIDGWVCWEQQGKGSRGPVSPRAQDTCLGTQGMEAESLSP